MIVEVTQENLAKALSMIVRIVGLKSTLPILNNVLLRTEKGRLTLTATDLELGLTTGIGAKIEKEGSFTLPAKLLGDLVATANGPTIRLAQKEGAMSVKMVDNEATIKGVPPDEFPLIPEVKQDPFISTSPLLLKDALRKAIVAAAVDEARPALSGVLFWRRGNILRLTATDSYRLAETKIDVSSAKESKTKDSTKAEAETKLIVPLRCAQELTRLLESGDDVVSVATSENQAFFKAPSFTLVSRLVEGEFPNYVDIIPASGQTTAKLPTDDLLRAIKVAALFAREVANHITLSASKGSLTVRAASPQLGENVATLAAETTGADLSVSFNARYLLDAVGSIASKIIDITLTGSTSPAVFREEGNPNFLHLVMPLRVVA